MDGGEIFAIQAIRKKRIRIRDKDILKKITIHIKVNKNHTKPTQKQMGNKAVFVDFCYGTNYNISKDYSLEAEAAERIRSFFQS